MHVIFQCPLCSPPLDIDYIIQLQRQPETWNWIGGTPPTSDYDYALWAISPIPQFADLTIHGQRGVQYFEMVKLNVSVTWDTTTHYFVDTWDVIYPNHATGSAEFDF